MIRHAPFVFVLAVAAAALAEGDDKPKAPPPTDGKTDGKPEAAPPKAEEHVDPIRGARWQITLRTGRSVTGVVTCDKVFERREGLNWVPAEKDAPGAGVRLYFVKDADGFVFVPTKDMKAAEKIEEIGESEGKDLAKRRIAAARRADEDRERIKAERARREEAARKASDDAGKGRGEKAKDGPTPEEQLARYTALLLKYPPGKWTIDTPKDIERRRIVMDLFPTDEEKAFLAVYDEWVKAYDAMKAGEDAQKPAPAAESAKR